MHSPGDAIPVYSSPRGPLMHRLLTIGLLALSLSTLVTGQSSAPSARPGAPPAAAFDRATYTIAHSSFVLDNGLRVIVHEDHSVPIVAVNLWYHVGSRNEQRGKT